MNEQLTMPMPLGHRSWRTRIGGHEFRVMRLSDAPAEPYNMDNPQQIVEYIKPKLRNSLVFRCDVENFIVVHLTVRHKPIGFEIITTGTLDTLLVHPREVFKHAIVANAHAVVLAHNHPSGDPSPSEADIRVTRDLIRAGQLLKIDVLDHVVLGRATPERPKEYSSLRELGYFYT